MQPSRSRFPALLAGAAALMAMPALAVDTARADADTNTANPTIAVANCNDSGPGSLRATVAGAPSGATIDMSALACREIVLTSGAIEVSQFKLSLTGGPPGTMKVDAGHRSGVFHHTGPGIFRLTRMNIADGATLWGGCIYSTGSVELLASTVHGCRAGKAGEFGRGGGIYAGRVRLVYSRVTGNTSSFLAGGIFASSGLIANHSHISGNRAGNRAAFWAQSGKTALLYSTVANNEGAGAIDVQGELLVANSTIAANRSTATAPGWTTLGFDGGAGQSPVTIINSTISGNSNPGGLTIYLGWGPKSIVNSTIAFNGGSGGCDGSDGGTVSIAMGSTLLDSTIISNNSCDGLPVYSIVPGDAGPWTVTGADNLVTTPARVALPADTLTRDPQLAALADNGGPTQTHALPPGSPAIDAGNNEEAAEYDQRGVGHARVEGTRADIGAFEL